ncbi:DoxX family protein [Streptomyces sp. NPDC020898]|uniref:DoxX family protein n=1 Tax=Streptomyces sp. NPDC020898 TaxID=3365101 RepID=UPI0037A1B73F
MNVSLWIVQALLAAFFGMIGIKKSTQSEDKVDETAGYSPATLRFIGIVEFAAALGLILPAAIDIAPVLTPLAATGLVVLMVLAAIFHARRKEPGPIAVNAVLLVLAALVAWGRFGPYSF